MDKRGKKSILSLVLTIGVIIVLIMSGPVRAVNVGITISSATPNEATATTFTVYVDILSGERIPVQNLTVTLTNTAGLANYSCIFTAAGINLTQCGNITITKLASQGYSNSSVLWGYGYGYDYTTGNGTTYINTTFNSSQNPLTWNSGYGYGYGETAGYNSTLYPYGELAYNITWTTPSVTTNTAYSVNFEAYVSDGVNRRTYQTVAPSTITVQNVAAATNTTDDEGTSGGGYTPQTITTPGDIISSDSQMWNQVVANTDTVFKVNDGLIAADAITFTTITTYNNVNVEVASVSKPVSLTAPDGTVYQYLKIDTKNLPDSGIKNAKIQFKIPLSWFSANNVNRNEITLYRNQNGAWVDLPTVELKTDATYAYFEATTPGFSYFAIGTKKAAPAATSTPANEENLQGTQPPIVENKESEETKSLPPETPKQSLAWLFWLLFAVAVVGAAIYFYMVKKK